VLSLVLFVGLLANSFSKKKKNLNVRSCSEQLYKPDAELGTNLLSESHIVVLMQ